MEKDVRELAGGGEKGKREEMPATFAKTFQKCPTLFWEFCLYYGPLFN